MNNTAFLMSTSLFMLVLTGAMLAYGSAWGRRLRSFLFADQSLTTVQASMAIASHWIWAIALFICPMVAYLWGIWGLLWFVIPNALSLVLFAVVAVRVRERYPNGFSMTKYLQERYSNRVSNMFRLLLLCGPFIGFILAFTAISKFWTYAGLGNMIDPLVVSGLVGLITLIYTARGGIKTGILTGSVQTVIWLMFCVAVWVAIGKSEVDIWTTGKNKLTTVFNEKFMLTFGISYLIGILYAALSHGMMWQKAFSMPKEKIVPSFSIAAVLFAIITFSLGAISLWAFQSNVAIKAPDSSAVLGVLSLLGGGGLLLFGLLLINQTSTVMDSIMSYVSSLVSTDKFNMKEDSKNIGRLSMMAILLISWTITWTGIEIWSIFVLMAFLRVVLFGPFLISIAVDKVEERVLFYSSLAPLIPLLVLGGYAKMNKLPDVETYAMVAGLVAPLVIAGIWQMLREVGFSKTAQSSEFIR